MYCLPPSTLTLHREHLWPVEVVWDRTASSRAAFPSAGTSTTVPKRDMFLPMAFRSSSYVSGKEGLYPSHLLQVGCGWGPCLKEYWRKVQITKTLFWINFAIGTSGPLDPIFHCSLCSTATELIFLFSTLLHLPPGNQKWPVTLHLLNAKGCKSTG